MNTVLIIAHNYEPIKKYLESNMNNIKIEGYHDIFRLKERLDNAPIRADVIVMRDSAFIDHKTGISRVSDAGSLLYNMLKGFLFEVRRIDFLSATGNEQEQEIMKFINNSDEIKTKINVYVSNKFEVRYIKELLVRPDHSIDLVEGEYSFVIRKRRGREIGSDIIESTGSDKALISLYPEHKFDKEDIKDQLDTIYYDEELIDFELRETDYETIENIDIEDPGETKEKVNLPKVIAVVGESKSGTSTTALTLASTASSIDKTLIIDMNWTNLGLTYLNEKTLIKDEINDIRVEDLLAGNERIYALKEKIFMKHRLHILSLTLPAKRMVSKEEYGLLISNIINYVRSHYRFIIIDMPFDDLNSYTVMLDKIEKIIFCTPPYINNIVSLLERVRSSNLVSTDLLKLKDNDDYLTKAVMLRTGVFKVVNPNIKPLSVNMINEYSTKFVNSKIKVASIYIHSGKSYIDEPLFRQIIL